MSEAALTRLDLRPRLGGAAWIAGVLGAVGVTAALQIHFGVNADASWMIEIGGRLLDGQTLYRDISENNPPAAFVIEALIVLLARTVGVSAEAATVALMILAAGAATALAGRILREADLLDARTAPVLAAGAAAALLLMPMQTFAQREHMAVLASLPALATLCARSAGRRPGLVASVLAGLGIGVMASIKPFFLLAFVGPLWCAGAAGPRRLFAAVELWVAAAAMLAYAAAVGLLFPAYLTDTVPLARLVYLPARLGLLDLLTKPMTLVWAVVVLVFWRAGGWAAPVGRILMLASAGFEASVFVQGKGFPYHGYPALALGGMACAAALARPVLPGRPRAGASTLPVLAALLASAAMFVDGQTADAGAPGLAEAIRSIAPKPRLLTIGGNLQFGPALAHALGGTWTGSGPAAWITGYATAVRADAESAPPFADRIAAERDTYAGDIARGRPDVVVIQGDGWKEWALRGPRLAAALSGYREAGRFGWAILLRRSPMAADTPAEAP